MWRYVFSGTDFFAALNIQVFFWYRAIFHLLKQKRKTTNDLLEIFLILGFGTTLLPEFVLLRINFLPV